MTIRRQIFISFVLVALLPLVVAAGFLFWTNERLTYDLYEENLRNASRVQVDILSEQINQSMVRAGRLASSQSLWDFLALSPRRRPDLLEYPNMVEELLRYKDETLESIGAVAIFDGDGEMVFSSGSNTEVGYLQYAVPRIVKVPRQSILELCMGEAEQSLLLVTPILVDRNESQGFLSVVLSTDYLFKRINNQQQFQFYNTFLYCSNQQRIICAKNEIRKLPDHCHELFAENTQGHIYCEIDGEKNLIHHQGVPRTSWVVVNSFPNQQILSQLHRFGLLNILYFVPIALLVMLLSCIQSKRILQPLICLLAWVESFFLYEDKVLPAMKMDAKTEIGYLAEKFMGMADDVAMAQMKLYDSNYLYEALLNATYELRLVVDFEENVITASAPALMVWLDKLDCTDAIEKAERLFLKTQAHHEYSQTEMMLAFVRGEVQHPAEVEICTLGYAEPKERWYRVIFVPIPGQDGGLKKVVLHFENITARKQEQLCLMESAQCDPLTGLLNKQAFTKLAKAFVTERPVGNTVIFLDLDNFKKVNDSLGHAVGDQVLLGVANTLRKQFRPRDLLARYGGDEFLVFASGLSYKQAEEKANDLLKAIPTEYQAPDGTSIRTSASMGVYHSRKRKSLEEMVSLADEAMYRAKKAGKSQYCMMEGEGPSA